MSKVICLTSGPQLGTLVLSRDNCDCHSLGWGFYLYLVDWDQGYCWRSLEYTGHTTAQNISVPKPRNLGLNELSLPQLHYVVNWLEADAEMQVGVMPVREQRPEHNWAMGEGGVIQSGVRPDRISPCPTRALEKRLPTRGILPWVEGTRSLYPRTYGLSQLFPGA